MAEVEEKDLQIDIYSNAAPWPNTKRGIRVTHKPTGLTADRDISEGGVQQARLSAIEEILDRMNEGGVSE